MMVNDFIFELGCEELPSRSVWPLANELANHVKTALGKAQLNFGDVKIFATPRRLALYINELQAEQASQTVTKKGPAAVSAYDAQGNPTPALLGFSKSCGVSIDQLTQIKTDKGDWLVYETVSPGLPVQELLPSLISQALTSLSIAKPMRWGVGDDEFARPVHWAVMLYGDEVLTCNVLGVTTGKTSRGHRFHHPDVIRINSPQSYESQMQEACVIADFSKRRELIKNQVEALATSYKAIAVMPEELLDEVTSIVEWPQALIANFEKEFLDVPPEALIASMQSHQKTFALKNEAGTLLPHFITVSNIKSTDPQQVIEGNEKVMRARLSDAAFFFNQDKKHPLSDKISATAQVVFQTRLGSLHEKSLRIKDVMSYLSCALEYSPALGERAASLSKCDLLTGMVGEFPELQGLMGYYYALNDGEDRAVAQALNEQYMPRYAGDELPQSSLGIALSLADRLDTLVGIFSIGQKPSGVKDPFKLRRHALAVVRLLIESKSDLGLTDLIQKTAESYESLFTVTPSVLSELKAFILDRLNSHYQSQGITSNLIQAVRAIQDDCFYDLDKRVAALKEFVNMPEAESLSAACKRVNNLLTQAQLPASLSISESLFKESAEHSLYENMNRISETVDSLYKEANYSSLLKELAGLREPVDAFFDQVMVMVENDALKNNRLALLQRLQQLLQGIADISILN